MQVIFNGSSSNTLRAESQNNFTAESCLIGGNVTIQSLMPPMLDKWMREFLRSDLLKNTLTATYNAPSKVIKLNSSKTKSTSATVTFTVKQADTLSENRSSCPRPTAKEFRWFARVITGN